MSDPEKQQTDDQPNDSGNPPPSAPSGGHTQDGKRSENPKRDAQNIQDNGTGTRHVFGLKRYELISAILLFLLLYVNWQYSEYAKKQWETMEGQLRIYYAQLMVSKNTLEHMKTSSAESSQQTDRIIHQAEHIGGAMDGSNAQNRHSLEASLNETEKSLTASISTARLDQRAWLGIGFFKIDQFEKDKSFKASVDIFNSGNDLPPENCTSVKESSPRV